MTTDYAIFKNMPAERDQKQTSFEEVISRAKEMMLRDGNHVPILIMGGGSNLAFVQIPELPATPKSRLELLKSLGGMAVKNRIIGQLHQVFMVSEGWLSAASKNNSVAMQPSQNPNKKEVLVISGIEITENTKMMKLFEISRDENQNVISLEEFLPKGREGNKLVEAPLLEAFVSGFKTAFRTKYN